MYGVPWIWKASVWWVETWRDTDHLALYLSNRTLGLDAVVTLGALPHMTCPVKDRPGSEVRYRQVLRRTYINTVKPYFTT